MKRLDTSAAAEYLGMPVASLKWRRAKNMPPRSYKIGRTVWWDLDDLDQFIDAEASRTERGTGA
ncbi:DNA-binding protein [Mycolicibacterium holsaticum]|uniref:Helix-turn-helix domain-containing protein n=1 Tax=Mycolicibacterium holsaticum TaxID=152142 RepID=A0A1E3S3C0_9MYCO|nr:DNA-binding protein [Mycolicibacterium holsaticum]ODQ96610.1 hypothetical protein BHQ17_00095 [Mycolicibacterium holsaticum]